MNRVSCFSKVEPSIGRIARAGPDDRSDRDLAGDREVADGLADERRGQLDLDHLDFGVAVLVLAVELGVRDHVEQPRARPRHRGDRRDAETAVDLGAARVVDARDDARHAIVLPRGARCDDVAVVSRGDSGEAVSVLDSGVLEHVAVEHRTDELLAEDLLALRTIEDERVLIDHRDRVPLELEHAREVPAHSPVPPDDYVQPVLHLVSPRLQVRSRAVCGTVPTVIVGPARQPAAGRTSVSRRRSAASARSSAMTPHSCHVSGAVLKTSEAQERTSAQPSRAARAPRPHQRSLLVKNPTARIDCLWVRIAKPLPTCAMTIPVKRHGRRGHVDTGRGRPMPVGICAERSHARPVAPTASRLRGSGRRSRTCRSLPPAGRGTGTP